MLVYLLAVFFFTTFTGDTATKLSIGGIAWNCQDVSHAMCLLVGVHNTNKTGSHSLLHSATTGQKLYKVPLTTV